MIDSSNIDSTFYQNFNSCVLTSYAIAANYFSQIPIENFFKDYCHHYSINISDEVKSRFCSELRAHEYFYDLHFQREWKLRKCPGLIIINELHNQSNYNSFLQARRFFNTILVSNCDTEKDNLNEKLTNAENLLIAANRVSEREVHISIFGKDINGFFNVETRPSNNNTRIIFKNNLSDFGQLGDGILLEKKN